ncbi:MAG: hypothetical protein ABS81_02685 [Pseudonocardia sp. SCN 72-86]|nr:MAG: hypothetical protein ABS81_02685 [Pseudonocardia sp. SCN 72-86]
MSKTLDGRVAVVTGASRGIGAEIARLFASEGAAVVVAARTTEQNPHRLPGTLDDTVRDIVNAGGRALAVPTDLSDRAAREHLIDATRAEFGPVDILVNNAAIAYFVPTAEIRLDGVDLMFAVQVDAPLHLSQLVLPEMKERRRGWILNVTSDTARHPRMPPNARWATGRETVYGMCKAALERLSTGLAAEVYADGIAVNALGPRRVVPTPGTIFHGVTTAGDPRSEPAAVMAHAAHALCSCDPGELTGRVARSQELLAELGLPIPTMETVDG